MKFKAANDLAKRQMKLQENNYKNYVEDKNKNNERAEHINKSFFSRTRGDDVNDTYSTRDYV